MSLRKVLSITVLAGLLCAPAADASSSNGGETDPRTLAGEHAKLQERVKELETALAAATAARAPDGTLGLSLREIQKSLARLHEERDTLLEQARERDRLLAQTREARTAQDRRLGELEQAMREREAQVRTLEQERAAQEKRVKQQAAELEAVRVALVQAEARAARLPSLEKERDEARAEAERLRALPAAGAGPAETALDLSPAEMLLDRRQFEPARKWLEERVPVERRTARFWLLLGQSLAGLGQHDKAVAAFMESAQRAPRDPLPLRDMALSLHQLKRMDRAADAYRRVIELNPRDGVAHFNLAALLLMMDKPDIKEAERLYRKSIELGEERDEAIERRLSKP